jgi:hypothetical protein
MGDSSSSVVGQVKLKGDPPAAGGAEVKRASMVAFNAG